MSIPAFSLARLPRVAFGRGALARLPQVLAPFGKSFLLVTGARSFLQTPRWPALEKTLRAEGYAWEHLSVPGEPSPQWVDEAVAALRESGVAAVVGIGGGSVLDAAKAVAGLLRPGNSVLDHLEGVGPERPYRGPATPFIAVPTTAGTGSEATKNAVLAVRGANGFKKSFRDEALVAQWALLDPDLLATCPPALIAANGMDALTQLIEAYVSTRANPFTDALALDGIAAVRAGLLAWHDGTEEAAAGQERMLYAAWLSGVCLAQTGLGSVHGLAAPLGAFFPIPHGVACGTLLAEATRVNIDLLEAREPENAALARYAKVGRLLRARTHVDDVGARVFLVHVLREWTEKLNLPRLSAYGMSEADIPRVVANCRGSSMKTNPVVLADEELACLLRARL